MTEPILERVHKVFYNPEINQIFVGYWFNDLLILQCEFGWTQWRPEELAGFYLIGDL